MHPCYSISLDLVEVPPAALTDPCSNLYALLDVQPHSTISLDLVEVRYVMAAPVVTLREQMRLGDVR